MKDPWYLACLFTAFWFGWWIASGLVHFAVVAGVMLAVCGFMAESTNAGRG